MKAHATKIPQRKTPYNKRNEIFNNGQDNAYPTLVETLINSSATAFACVNVISAIIQGGGFVGVDMQQIINRRGETLGVLLAKLSTELAYYRGAFLHINYNALYQVTGVQVVPYKYARLGRLDDQKYRGKIAVYDNWDGEKGSVKTSQIQWIHTYNPTPQIIQQQVEKAGGWNNYKGQICFLNLDYNDTYPFAFINPVMNDCESEYYSSVFSNKIFKKGFLGQYILATKPMQNDDEREHFRQVLNQSAGVESENSIIHFEVDLESENPQNEYQLTPITTNTNDKIFEYTDRKISNNIRRAFGNIPPVLIDAVEGKLGNTSGEAFVQAQQFLEAQTHKIRQEIQRTLQQILERYKTPIVPPNGLEIITLSSIQNN